MGKSRKEIEYFWFTIKVALLFVLFLSNIRLASQTCIHQVYPPPSGFGTTIIDTITFPGILPGDVICLMAGKFHQILIRDIHGLPGKPVTFRNEGGQVIINNDTHYGISVRNCSFVDFTGNGHSEIQYGIFIQKVGNGGGITFEKLSTNISVSFFEIANVKLAAIIAKSDPNCTFESLRGNFTMYDVMIHDNYIHDVEAEAIYIGHSYYNGFIMNCDGTDTLVLPHVVEGVYVYKNVINRTGRNAFQIGSAFADCKIYDNLISYDSQAETYNQMGGIIIGGGSVCDCFNNRISDGKGSGIEVFGRGNFMIYNNLIEYPGREYQPDTAHYVYPKHGIFVKDVNTDPDAKIQIFHNTIISPKSDGILFTNENFTGSQIQNNIIINPGSYQEIGENAFVHNNNIDLVISHNFFSLSNEEAMFNDCLNNDYSLKLKSPAVDKGKDLSDFDISFDYVYNSRPLGKGFDIGAYESDPDDEDEETNNILVYPNPFTDKITVVFCQLNQGDVKMELFNLTGQKVFKKKVKNVPAGSNELEFTIVKLQDGIYLIRLIADGKFYTTRILKIG